MNCECHDKKMHMTPWGKYVCTTTNNIRLKSRNRNHVMAEAARRGNHCQRCPGGKGLEWHHRDPSAKLKDISRMVSERSGIRLLKAELAKCDLLCGSCHKKAQKELRNA